MDEFAITDIDAGMINNAWRRPHPQCYEAWHRKRRFYTMPCRCSSFALDNAVYLLLVISISGIFRQCNATTSVHFHDQAVTVKAFVPVSAAIDKRDANKIIIINHT
jgi:hypothetical protein